MSANGFCMSVFGLLGSLVKFSHYIFQLHHTNNKFCIKILEFLNTVNRVFMSIFEFLVRV